jgi:hypothetical protein
MYVKLTQFHIVKWFKLSWITDIFPKKIFKNSETGGMGFWEVGMGGGGGVALEANADIHCAHGTRLRTD